MSERVKELEREMAELNEAEQVYLACRKRGLWLERDRDRRIL
jgi:hypothetical protein